MKEIVNLLHENRQIELAKEILESAGYTVSLKESKEEKLTYEDLKAYPYRFNKVWKAAVNPTYADDFLELAEEYNCLQLYKNIDNTTFFICKDKSDYENLKDALEQNKILKDFISLSAVTDMDWDALTSKTDHIYVDKYIGGYTVKFPRKRVKESTNDYSQIKGRYGKVRVYKSPVHRNLDTLHYASFDLATSTNDKGVTGYVPVLNGERPLPMWYDSVEAAVKGLDNHIQNLQKQGRMLYLKPIEEALYIDDLIEKVGDPAAVNAIIDDAIKEYYPEGIKDGDDIEELADITYPKVESKVSKDEWKEIIEYVW